MKRSAPEPPPPPDGAIMTLPQVAEYLHCHPSTLYRLLRRRNFPGFHLGGDWRFRRADIEAWIAAQQMEVSAEEDEAGEVKRAQQPAKKKAGPGRPLKT
jgi:excisionase family DNA binding protein